MPRTHSIDATEMFEPVEVKLFDGSKFRLRQATQSVEKKVDSLQKQIQQLAKKTEPEEREVRALRRQMDQLIDDDPGSEQIEKLEDEIQDKREEIEAKGEIIEQEGLPFLIEMLHVLLEPLTPKKDPETDEQVMVESEENPGEMVPAMVTAEESLTASLDADKIGITHINALSQKLNETALEARPT